MNKSTLTVMPQPQLHVAILLDGNGRWAASHGLARSEGHRAGVEAVRRVVRAAPGLGIGQVQVKAEIPVRLPRHAIRIAQQLQTVAVHIAQTKCCLRTKLVFDRQVCLLHVWTAEIGREDHNRRSSAGTAGKGAQAVGIRYERIRVSKSGTHDHQERASDAIGRESLGNVEQVFLDVEQTERSADDRGTLVVETVGKAHPRRHVVLAIRDVASERERRVALGGLGEDLQVITRAIV